MKVALTITAVLMILLLAMGWRNQRRIDELRSEHRTLVKRVEASGIEMESLAPEVEESRLATARPDPAVEARRVAAMLVGYGREMAAMGKDDPAAREASVLEASEQVIALNGSQLKVLIDVLRAEPGLDGERRAEFLRFALRQLLQTHPRDALEVLLEEPALDPPGGSWPPRGLACDAMRVWSRDDPAGARKWYENHRSDLSDDEALARAWLDGAMVGDPLLALQVAPPSLTSLSGLIGYNCREPGERLAFLDAWRVWSDTGFEPGEAEAHRTSSVFGAIAFGDMDQRPVPFEETRDHLIAARFSPEELDQLTRMSFDQYVRFEDTARWLEWLDEAPWPELHRERYRSHLLTGYSTSLASAGWLMDQPCSDRRTAMIRRCAPEAFRRDRRTGIRLALALPDEDVRRGMLEGFYRSWPRTEPEDQAAAEQFAREHGLD